MENEKEILAKIEELEKIINSQSQFISRLVNKLESKKMLDEAEVNEIVFGEEEQ